MLAHDVLCSKSRKGDCWYNAPMESFFTTLKGELVEEADYQARDQATADVVHYIEGFYYMRRLHSTPGYFPPGQKAVAFHPVASAAKHCPRMRRKSKLRLFQFHRQQAQFARVRMGHLTGAQVGGRESFNHLSPLHHANRAA